MRRLFSKAMQVSSVETSLIAPYLPSDITYSELTFRTKRGFLAKKICHYLGLHNDEADFIYYFSLSKSSLINSVVRNNHELILRLSELMISWSSLQQELPPCINRLEVNDHFKDAMLKTYENNKQEVFTSNDGTKKHQIKASREQSTDPTWTVYRDVLFAATQGQLLLISKDEVSQYKTGNVLCKAMIKSRSDIPLCRNQAKEHLEQQIVNSAKVIGCLLVLSEAITNTIKHAEKGKMTLIRDLEKGEIRFVIEDEGPGFPLECLPKATLMAGFSTKKSMGQGFTLMMKMAKQVVLYTSSNGSTLILSFDIREESVKKEII